MRPLIPFFDHPHVTLPLPFDLPGPSGPVSELTVYGFGILVAVGFLVGARVAQRRAERLGLSGEHVNKLIGWLVVGTFVGGHLGYALMYEPATYLADPRKLLHVWEGLSSFGGIVTCIAISVFYFRWHKLPVWPYLDCLAHGMAIGWAFGRSGCTVAHDHPGLETDFWLGRTGICLSGDHAAACHDLGMYEMLWSWALYGLLTATESTASGARAVAGEALRRLGPWLAIGLAYAGGLAAVGSWYGWPSPLQAGAIVGGAVTVALFAGALLGAGLQGSLVARGLSLSTVGVPVLLLGAAYGPVRFVLDFLRPESSDPRWAGLTAGQWWASIFAVACVALLARRARAARANG